jgi:urease gamma subunit
MTPVLKEETLLDSVDAVMEEVMVKVKFPDEAMVGFEPPP